MLEYTSIHARGFSDLDDIDFATFAGVAHGGDAGVHCRHGLRGGDHVP